MQTPLKHEKERCVGALKKIYGSSLTKKGKSNSSGIKVLGGSLVLSNSRQSSVLGTKTTLLGWKLHRVVVKH